MRKNITLSVFFSFLFLLPPPSLSMPVELHEHKPIGVRTLLAVEHYSGTHISFTVPTQSQ